MKWSEDQIQELRQMAADGVSNTNMALHFGVMLSEIHAKRSQLGITRAKLQAKKADSAPLNTRPQKSPTQKAQGIDSIDIEELTRRVITELKRILLAESENASLSTPTESSLLDLFCKVHEESEKHRRTVLDRTFGEMKEVVKNQLALLSNADDGRTKAIAIPAVEAQERLSTDEDMRRDLIRALVVDAAPKRRSELLEKLNVRSRG